jgi:hypothetical protein
MPEGTAREAINVRPGSITGNAGGAEAIKGEVVQYPVPDEQPDSTGYVLIGSCTCNNQLVEFWASENFDFISSTFVPIVRVDGVVVAQSRNIPYVWNRPLQIAVVDNLLGNSIAQNQTSNGVVLGRGVVYPADHNSEPLYWDIDLLVNNNADYFGDSYTIALNSVNLLSVPEFPVHTRNLEVGSDGLLTGQYAYSLRYVTPAGDRTNVGPETPLISVPLNQHPIAPDQQNQYPGVLTIGGLPGEFTGYGIELQFRVDNQYGFSKVEIVRRRLNTADNLPVLEIVGIIPIVPGQVSIETFIDPQNAISIPEIITEEEVAQRLIAVNKPKTVEYSDRRLTYANFESQPRTVADIEFLERNGNTVFPITQGVYTRLGSPGNYTDWNDGYSDPVNNTYLKSYIRGERYGLGVMFWDQYSSTSYVTEVAQVPDEGYQFPNRLDPKRGDSVLFSDAQLVAPTTETIPSQLIEPTFDAFAQGNKRKSHEVLTEPPYEGYGYIGVTAEDAGQSFSPWGPTNPITLNAPGIGGNDQTRMSQSPVSYGCITRDDTVESVIDGQIWAPRHHALGAAISGITNIPSRIRAFSVMRTAPAERVVAQGIACWIPERDSIVNPGPPVSLTSFYKKEKRKLRLIVPDFNNGSVGNDVIERFQASAAGLKLQFVRPVGFYTELYNRIDFVSYAGVQQDAGQVNFGLEAPPGLFQGYFNQVGYNAYRTLTPSPGAWGVAEGGNRLFNIENAVINIESTYNNWTVTVDADIYDHEETLPADSSANDASFRDFTEPWYIVNIVADGAEVSNDSIDRYINTGMHIKTDSCIGVSNGQAGQVFPLLNERRGDVYADPSTWPQPPVDPSTGAYNRYIYIELNNQAFPYLCVTDNSEANLNQPAILAQLNAGQPYTMSDGTDIYGVYEFIDGDTWTSSSRKDYTGSVRFGSWSLTPVPAPPQNTRIIVRYNPAEPIRFFGGDATVTPSLGLLFNRQALGNPDEGGYAPQSIYSQAVGAPIPYRAWRKNPGYNMRGFYDDAISPLEVLRSCRARQWAVYFDCERRTAPRFLTGNPVQQGPFEWPRIGYIIKPEAAFSTDYTETGPNGRPNAWYQYPLVTVNGVDAFRPDSLPQAAFGGFLWQSGINQSYIQQPPVSGFGIPFDEIGGLQDRNYFPTGLIASLEIDPLLQDSPGLRTFLDLNLKTISEENGEIKTIASALAGGGRNLYAWTENGVSRVLTNKNVLTGADGSTLGTQSISNYWGQEMWISRNIGSPDQMWQMMVKGYAPAGSDYSDSFFWPDRNSIYRMVGDSIIDIGRQQILSYALPILRQYPRGYVPGVSGIYNRKFNEAWMPLFNKNVKKLLVYSPEINAWNGIYDYSFDGYTQVGNDVFGHRGLQTFKLDQGWTINSTARQASVTVPMVGDIDTFKEFIRWRVVGSKPDAMEILDPDFVVMSRMDAATNGSPLWVKEYDGWEGWASRTLASYDSQRKLPQKRYFYLRLIWNREEDVNATSLSGQLKPIK